MEKQELRSIFSIKTHLHQYQRIKRSDIKQKLISSFVKLKTQNPKVSKTSQTFLQSHSQLHLQGTEFN